MLDYVFAINCRYCTCLWNIVEVHRLIKAMISEIQKAKWWSVRFQYSTESSCLRWYLRHHQKTVAKNENRS